MACTGSQPVYQTTMFTQISDGKTYGANRYLRCCNNPNQTVRPSKLLVCA